MVRPPCCEGKNLKKGPWTPEEDERLVGYVGKHGHSNWKAIPKLTGLNRCGKSCRLRWTNYLRPDIKRGKFSDEEEHLIVNLHAVLGNKWSRIATHLPGRTDNEIKNYWNTHIRKKLLQMGIDPITHKPRNDPNQQLLNLVQLLGGAAAQPTNFNNSNNNNPLDIILLMKLLQPADAAQLMKMELLQNLLLAMSTTTNTLHSTNNNQYTNMANLIPQNIVNPVVDAPPQDLNSNHLHQVNSHGARSDSEAYHDQVMASYGGGGLNINESEKENTNKLPELVLASISPETSSYDALFERKSNSSTCENSPTSAIFEDWEKLLDEESFDAYWKDFLE